MLAAMDKKTIILYVTTLLNYCGPGYTIFFKDKKARYRNIETVLTQGQKFLNVARYCSEHQIKDEKIQGRLGQVRGMIDSVGKYREIVKEWLIKDGVSPSDPLFTNDFLKDIKPGKK